ncbi:hypothetical protein F5X68DRAFT_211365 [Plectosphaerella plurivora]|uniref:Uncharacterized protein n=1 Tax=Plectosphaerella plurivora TaxID=936078 RepID=A0A9P8V7U1_9PEZI|nr:hypothetical protein F5X68DRAFT_211365 [Plectosphaerella plurivora]
MIRPTILTQSPGSLCSSHVSGWAIFAWESPDFWKCPRHYIRDRPCTRLSIFVSLILTLTLILHPPPPLTSHLIPNQLGSSPPCVPTSSLPCFWQARLPPSPQPSRTRFSSLLAMPKVSSRPLPASPATVSPLRASWFPRRARLSLFSTPPRPLAATRASSSWTPLRTTTTAPGSRPSPTRSGPPFGPIRPTSRCAWCASTSIPARPLVPRSPAPMGAVPMASTSSSASPTALASRLPT